MKLNFQNQLPIEQTDEYKRFELEYENNIEFLEKFSNLVNLSGRLISFITDKNHHIVHGHLLDSSVKTLKSIKLCCSIGSFADANTLIRKLRDDLLLYVYTLAVVNQRKPFTQKSLDNVNLESLEEFLKGFSSLEFNTVLTDDEIAIDAWLNNKVFELPRKIKDKLSFKNYMEFLKQNENIKTVLTTYNLLTYWERLTIKLNNYVHNNGKQFTIHNLIRSDNEQLEIYLDNVNVRLSYITTYFIVLITMIESALLCSGEIEDHLNLGMEPPEDCQYEIAPFIQEFIDQKVVKIHPELKQYLKDNNNNGMKIE